MVVAYVQYTVFSASRYYLATILWICLSCTDKSE
jgi:hypothetical protein